MARSYESTHPWLTFRARLDGASPRLWMLLGECQSKCEHVAHTPLRPATAKELHQIYLAKGALATTAIEGNTLSEEEVLRHIQHGLVLPPSQAYLTQEIDNIVEGCNHIGDDILQGRTPIVTPESIAWLNRTVLRGLRLEEGVVPGELRTHSVVVGRYRGAPAEDLTFLLDRLCEWINGEEFAATEGLRIVYAILKAVIAHLYLAWIHPFGDGNGRTARLLEFQILLTAGVPSPSAHLLSNFYNRTRTEYYRQLSRASESGGDILPFIEYAVTGFCDELRLQIDRIWEQQWDVAWRNYVHETFRDKSSKAHVRQRRLALDLSLQAKPVPKADVSRLTPRLAEAYARLTPVAVTRDLNALIELGLIKRVGKGYVANKEQILAFLPPRAGEEPPSVT